jgi:hypothetical protein
MGATLCTQEETPYACSGPFFLSDTFLSYSNYQLAIIPYYLTVTAYSVVPATGPAAALVFGQ